MESLLKLGSKDMEKEKTSSVKSTQSRRGAKKKEQIKSVSGKTFVNTAKGLKGSRA